jgi:hypothetical protein
MCEAPKLPELSCGLLLLLAGPTPGGGGGGGGTFDVLLLRAMAANTHPITVPVKSASWVPNNTRVVDWIPINTGRLLCRKKEFLSASSKMELVSEGFRKVPDGGGTSLAGSWYGVMVTGVSAGWRAGKGARSIVWEGSWVCSWTPSMKPISPRFDGRGPACGLTCCVRVVEEDDATAFVEAITDSSGRSGKRVYS